ncbi:MAG: hypothetical protein AAGA66_16530 [Bacteroidota bacterium]
MASSAPTFRKISWFSLVPQILLMAGLILGWDYFYPSSGFLYGACSYLIISIVLRNSIAKHHRSGIQKVRAGDFANAITDFEKSYAFFSKNAWVDTYRYLTLLSSSRMSYKEMALNNIAFSYSQIGEGAKAKEYYQQTLQENPNNALAISALKMLSSTSKEEG